jgi:hypothetical protein
MRLPNTEVDFWKHVQKTNGCWLWIGATLPKGYGYWHVAGRRVYAHRYVWTITFGKIPESLFVCHHCDTPSCVRPSHLFVGTAKDNMTDMWRKGRGPTGARHGSQTHPESIPRGQRIFGVKLTEDIVRSLREEYAVGGISITRLAAKWNLSRSLVAHVIMREAWKYVEAPHG